MYIPEENYRNTSGWTTGEYKLINILIVINYKYIYIIYLRFQVDLENFYFS